LQHFHVILQDRLSFKMEITWQKNPKYIPKIILKTVQGKGM